MGPAFLGNRRAHPIRLQSAAPDAGVNMKLAIELSDEQAARLRENGVELDASVDEQERVVLANT